MKAIRGTHLGVSAAGLPRIGATVDEILTDYRHLKREDILAAIAYGADMSRERFVDLPVSAG